MLELGKRQDLIIHRLTEIGAYVGEENSPETAILLPRRQVASDAKTGDVVNVLVYKDSEDRMLATIHESKLVIGQVGFLKVVQVASFGAFLDWGLERDLFLPFKEQTKKPAEGDQVLVTMYVDKSERLCATMKIYDHMSAESPYETGDTVSGIVYEIKPLGAFVAVDDKYFGLIPSQEVYQDFKAGDRITAQVMKRRKDGKLDLRVRKKAYKQMDQDGALLWEQLEKAGGFLPYHDKSDPEVIRSVFGMSKAAFKRAEGHLLKEGKILLKPDGIYRKEEK